MEASVAWAVAMAADGAASADWAMAVATEAMDVAATAPLVMEATGMAAAAHCAMEDMDSMASTNILSQQLTI